MTAEHNRLEVPWRIRLARPRIVVCTIVVALACFLRCPSARPLPPAALHPVSALSEASSTNNNGPNIVFVLTDDLSWNLIQYMPHVLEMQDHGVTFTDYFVTDSLCCPSRASIFTGLYPHNTGIFSNKGPDGGYVAFRKRGEERTTFAKALSAAGYRTAMMGKYLNGYDPRLDPAGLGWTSWLVGGSAYAEFNYLLNQDGEVVRHGSNPSEYLTDVLSQMAVSFIGQSAGEPFFIEIATFAPHAPYTPAPRDADALPGLRAPRTPAFDAEADSHAPRWLRSHPALSEEDITNIDQGFRKRAQSVLAVDAMIGSLQDALASTGQDQNTYFVFSSDNGYHMGEYRLTPGKMTAYDTDIRVPLIVTGPGVAAGRTIEEIVENVDLAPTFTELAGAAQTGTVDGRSIVPLLLGDSVEEWRISALVEHHGPVQGPSDPDVPDYRSGNPTTYEAIRTNTFLYVEYVDGEREYHDLSTDPDELRNTFSKLSVTERAALHAMIERIQRCKGTNSCWAAELPSEAAEQG